MKFPVLYRVLSCLCLSSTAYMATAQKLDDALAWRNIGPFRGGRVSSVTGAVGIPGTFYIGLPQGGIWKTTSNGVTWYPVADSIRDISCFGSIQAAPSDPNVIYAGSGEAIGGYGNGVYKSTDAGANWTHLPGLEQSRRIPTIIVDPHDANKVLIAALGGREKSEQRGVFRTVDGGRTWRRTLFIANDIGVINIASAYDRPETVFAVSSSAGGPQGPNGPAEKGASLYRSQDGGETWTKLQPKGLPVLTGRSALAVANTTGAQRVFIIGTWGLYRSDDGGVNWTKMAKDDPRIQNGQGNYSCGVYVDPKNPDVVYTVATCVFRSTDGGLTFSALKGAPGGDDPHDIWIDPNDSNRILLGGDQGATVSVDGGKTWSLWYNQPTGQLYSISTDNRFPYWVYGTQQDSGCVAVATRGNLGEITPWEWYPQAGFEIGTTVVDPLNSNNVWALGFRLGLMKISYPSGQFMEIGPDLNPNSTLHTSNNTPLAFSYWNPRELLVGYSRMLATTDEGQHWRELSPELTGEKPRKNQPGLFGRFGASIFCFSESTAARGVLWAGTTNGLVQVTKDGGKTWSNVTPKLQGKSSVACLDASHLDPAEAYVGMQINGDNGAHFYRTKDYGRTWSEIDEGMATEPPIGGPAMVVRADTKQKGLLFASAGEGIYVSFDDGSHWQSLRLNLPAVTVTDLQIHGNDLIAATFGRAIWVLDDFSPLRQITSATMAEAAHLYKPGGGYRTRRNVNLDTPLPPEVPHAQNPPQGAMIYYSLGAEPKGEISLDILDSSGKLVRHYSSTPAPPYSDPPTAIPDFWIAVRRPLSKNIGLNGMNWDGRYEAPPAFVHDPQDTIEANPGATPQSVEGPLALPGEYTVRLTVDGRSQSQPVKLVNDPRVAVSGEDLRAEEDLLLGCYQGAITAYNGAGQVNATRAQVAKRLASSPAVEAAKALKDYDEKLSSLAGVPFRGRPIFGPPPPTNFSNLVPFLEYQLAAWDNGDVKPTDGMRSEYGYDWAKLHAACEQWRDLNGAKREQLNAVLAKSGLPPIPAQPGVAEPPSPGAKWLPPKE